MTTAYEEALDALKEADQSGDVADAYEGTNKSATVRARKAFLKAKKALHRARQEVQDIKKGGSPKQVESYFSEEEN